VTLITSIEVKPKVFHTIVIFLRRCQYVIYDLYFSSKDVLFLNSVA